MYKISGNGEDILFTEWSKTKKYTVYIQFITLRSSLNELKELKTQLEPINFGIFS